MGAYHLEWGGLLMDVDADVNAYGDGLWWT